MPLPAETRNLIHQLVVDIVSAIDDAYEGRPTQASSDGTKANGGERNDFMEVDKGLRSAPILSTPRIALATFIHSLIVGRSSTN